MHMSSAASCLLESCYGLLGLMVPEVVSSFGDKDDTGSGWARAWFTHQFRPIHLSRSTQHTVSLYFEASYFPIPVPRSITWPLGTFKALHDDTWVVDHWQSYPARTSMFCFPCSSPDATYSSCYQVRRSNTTTLCTLHGTFSISMANQSKYFFEVLAQPRSNLPPLHRWKTATYLRLG
jgi:hypothetical protein